jgi:hypothetical protein
MRKKLTSKLSVDISNEGDGDTGEITSTMFREAQEEIFKLVRSLVLVHYPLKKIHVCCCPSPADVVDVVAEDGAKPVEQIFRE